MSIQSEITRITNKRDASLAAVANKGVTVPAGSTIDDLPDLIVAIPTGASTYSVSASYTNVTSSNNDTEVLQGGSFFADLTPAEGTRITSITVMMGGVDVTSLVFTPGVGEKEITANGTYTASTDSLLGYSSVSVDVPNSYAAADEGKVVSNGALVSQTSATYTLNSTYDTTLIDSVTVNVSGGGVIPTGTKEISITQNGTVTEDVTAYANVEVTTNVSTSFSVDLAGSGTNTITLNIPFTPAAIIYFELDPLTSGSFVSTTHRVAGVWVSDKTRGYYVPQGNTTRGGYMQLTSNHSYDTTTGVFSIGSSSVLLLASKTYRFIAIK